MADTFGKTVKGLTAYDHPADYIMGSLYGATLSGKVASLTIYTKYKEAANMKCAIYASDKTFIAGTEQKAVGAAQDGWLTLDFSSPPDVVAETSYWLLFWRDGKVTHYHDVEAGATGLSKNLAYNNWPASFVASTNNNEYSIYATYSEAPPSAKTLVQATLISAVPLIAIPTLYQILRFAGG